MEYLIFYAHPDTGGHCNEILKNIVNQLDNQHFTYKVYDLYKINYDPILSANEHYTAGNKNISKLNQEIQNEIKETKNLIFIYPVWWGTMPAILKGLIDRVFTNGFSFEYKNGLPIGLLKGKKAIVYYTSGGPRWYFLITGNRPKKNIKNDILEFCGIKTKVFHLTNANKFDSTKIPKIKKMVKNGFCFLK